MIPEWPKLDPITGRKICRSCWNNVHRKHNASNVLVDACDGECDCIHRSEENWAAIERQKKEQNKKKLLRKQLENPQNPLLAVNDSFKPKKSGKAHA